MGQLPEGWLTFFALKTEKEKNYISKPFVCRIFDLYLSPELLKQYTAQSDLPNAIHLKNTTLCLQLYMHINPLA